MSRDACLPSRCAECIRTQLVSQKERDARRQAMRIRQFLLIAAGFAAIVATGAAQADLLPTHGAHVHLDPFIPGWPVPPVFAPPGPGVVKPVNGVAPDAEYDVLGPVLTVDKKHGVDGFLGGEWHWENEFDLDPYPRGGVALVTFNFTAFGGPVIGPVPVPLIAGPDIYLDIDQPDQGAAGEFGPFDKFLINLTDIPVGWGTSVTEDPAGTPEDFTKTIRLFGDPGFFLSIPENTNGHNAWELANIPGGFMFRQVRRVPEPGSLAFFTLGVGVLALALRRRHGVPKA
jgi:hypothetical protein